MSKKKKKKTKRRVADLSGMKKVVSLQKGICSFSGKKMYNTLEDAQTALELIKGHRIARQILSPSFYKKSNDKIEKRAYYCVMCNKYHLTAERNADVIKLEAAELYRTYVNDITPSVMMFFKNLSYEKRIESVAKKMLKEFDDNEIPFSLWTNYWIWAILRKLYEIGDGGNQPSQQCRDFASLVGKALKINANTMKPDKFSKDDLKLVCKFAHTPEQMNILFLTECPFAFIAAYDIIEKQTLE